MSGELRKPGAFTGEDVERAQTMIMRMQRMHERGASLMREDAGTNLAIFIAEQLAAERQAAADGLAKNRVALAVGRIQGRPSFFDLYLTMAELLASRSTCKRLQVGCVITSHDHRRVLSVGYNGGAAGLDNDCESTEPGMCGHLHAEENAAIACTAPRGEAKRVYCTDLPCKMCAKRLINLGGVTDVVFVRDYRVRDSIDLFARAGICVMASTNEVQATIDAWRSSSGPREEKK